MTTTSEISAMSPRAATRSSSPLRIALVGCGAVARANLLPVLAGHTGIRLAALVDRDEARARALADAYQVPTVHSDLDALTAGAIDASHDRAMVLTLD